MLFSAASLTECLDEFAASFEEANPGVTVRANYAGTQELRLQVEQGAVCDVFIAANKVHMDALVEGEHIVDPQVLAHNGLCLAAEKGGRVKSLHDAAEEGVRLVVATPTCPAGRYTRECWKNMGESDEFGAEFIAGLTRNVVSQETNVKLVLSKVVLGEADACFVYRSDVLGQNVDVIDIPESVQVRATYLVGVGTKAKSPELAERFIDALLSDSGMAAFEAAGLEVPKSNE